MLSRLLIGSGVTLIVGCAGVAESGGSGSLPWLSGADVSALPVFEKHGAVFRDGGRPGDALALLRVAGMNTFRLRLFVAPDGKGVVTNDLDYTIALAKRVKASGARLILDLHYSDTWADPAKQFKPAAWAGLSFDDLVVRVGEYTRDVISHFAEAGVTPDIVQVGNEITNGLLWPDGRVEFADGDVDPAPWRRLARLLRAGLEAVPQGPGAPQRLLHIESTGNIPRSKWFFRHVFEEALPFELVGISYYPEWHGTLEDLRETMNFLAENFRKPVIVVETAYPWKDDEHWRGKKHMSWPLSPKGQQRFLAGVTAAVRAVPHGLGRGVICWHPESVRVRDLNVWVGGSCALFDDRGRMLPGAEALR